MAMDMQGEERIEAPIQKVWEALNDPEILKACIPGCQSLEKKSDTHLEAVVSLKIGPIKAKFQGAVELKNLKPPHSYTIQGEGKGGIAGFAKGGATVKLSDDASGGTVLSYVVEANVGGKLAQIGSRLIDATARQMAENFFSKFADVVAKSAAAPVAAPAPAAAATAAPVSSPSGAAAGEAPPATVAEMPPPPAPSVEVPPPRPATPSTPGSEGKRLSPAIWVTALAVIVILLLYFFTR